MMSSPTTLRVALQPSSPPLFSEAIPQNFQQNSNTTNQHGSSNSTSILLSPSFHEQLMPTSPFQNNSRSRNSGTSTPTLHITTTSTRIATSPPLLPLQPRRLSMATATVEFEMTSALGVGGNTSQLNSSDVASTDPSNMGVFNDGPSSRVCLHSFFPVAASLYTLPSVSVASSSSTSREEGRQASRHQVVATHRRIAAQAAEESDRNNAIAAVDSGVTNTSHQSNRRRSTRLAHVQGVGAETLGSPARSAAPASSSRELDSSPNARISSMSFEAMTEVVTLSSNNAAATDGNDTLSISRTRTAYQDVSVMPPKKRPKFEARPQSLLKKPPPSTAAKDSIEISSVAPTVTSEDDSPSKCAICMSEPSKEEISTITGCSHSFCFSCISKWSERENTCPLCKSRFSKITRVHRQRRKKNCPSIQNTKRVKDRDQRSDIVTGAALEGLLASIASSTAIPRYFVSARMNGIQDLMRNVLASNRANLMGENENAHFALDHVFDSSSDEDEVTANNSFLPGGMDLFTRTMPHFNGLTGQQQRFFPFPPTAAAAASFLNARNAVGSSASVTSPNFIHVSSAPYHYNLRSYTSTPNVNERNTTLSGTAVGGGPSNPLEIDDDDDDNDDDSVEVVQVVQNGASAVTTSTTSATS